MGMTPGTGTTPDSHQDIDLPPEHLGVVRALLQSHLPGVAVWAYGSRVTGNARRYSDLDLVAFPPPEQGKQVQELREAFEESDLPFRIDLFSWSEIPASFHQGIQQKYAVLQHGNGGIGRREASERL